MSVTTTDNARITNLRHVLADYELHHSEPTQSEAQPAPAPNEHDDPVASNPAGWATEWRRVPAYRPVQNQRDEQRDTYTGAIERNFVRVMFGGVYTMAVSWWNIRQRQQASDLPTAHKSNLAKYRREAEERLLCIQDWRRMVARKCNANFYASKS